MPAYLDHAATTPLRPEALAAMLPWLSEHYGNPSGPHRPARQARRALDEARDTMAAVLGCAPGEVVFTSGGTEADNLAVQGALRAAAAAGRVPVVLCSAVEHHAVLDACAAAGGRTVGVGPDGAIDLDALADALGDDVSVVSVMLANNETGAVQPLEAVAAVLADRAPGAVLHTDAVHAAAWMDLAGAAAPAALVTVSAHKVGGPKGVGALVVREGTPWAPVTHGGGQERGRRPGTPDVAGIVGMAAAFAAAAAHRAAERAAAATRRDRLGDGLAAEVRGLVETGARPGPHGVVDRSGKVPGSCHVRVEGVDNEELLVLLDDAGVYASAGSSCASGAMEPSHVLLAMGLDARTARSAVRFSLGWTTTDADVDLALEVVPAAVKQLRR